MHTLHTDIRFDAKGNCLVSMAPPHSDDAEKYGEVLLFVHYALRILKLTTNKESRAALSSFLTLMAPTLQPTVAADFLRQQGLTLMENAKPKGKGFEIGFAFTSKTYELKVRPYGFGLHVRDEGLYAPTSVLVLYCWLLLRRAQDAQFVSHMQAIAAYCGQAGASGQTAEKFEDQAAIALAARMYPRVFAQLS